LDDYLGHPPGRPERRISRDGRGRRLQHASPLVRHV